MSEEIALARADLAELARLTTELAAARADLTQSRNATEAERAKRRSIERAVRAWADMSKHPPMDCAECEDLYRIAQGTHADTELMLLRDLFDDVQRWRATGGDPRDLSYVLETADKLTARSE